MLLSKGIANIYLKVTTETFSKLRFSGFKKFVTRSVFGELQFTKISLNFKTSCCNLKIRGLGAKLCVRLFYYFNFERNYDVLKSKSPCILLNKNIKYTCSNCNVTYYSKNYRHFLLGQLNI